MGFFQKMFGGKGNDQGQPSDQSDTSSSQSNSSPDLGAPSTEPSAAAPSPDITPTTPPTDNQFSAGESPVDAPNDVSAPAAPSAPSDISSPNPDIATPGQDTFAPKAPTPDLSNNPDSNSDFGVGDSPSSGPEMPKPEESPEPSGSMPEPTSADSGAYHRWAT